MVFWRRSKRNPGSNPNIVSAIPRYLHFTWGFFSEGLELPDAKRSVIRQWKRCNPQWQGEIHRPPELDLLAAKWDRETYGQLKNSKQRCDVARFLLLSEFGGAYSELDLHPYHGMDSLLAKYASAQVVLLERETLTKRRATQIGQQQSVRQGKPVHRLRIANYWLASAPYHAFWQDVLALIRQRCTMPVSGDDDIDYTTGADVITEVYHRTKSKYHDVVVVPKKLALRYFGHDAEGSWRGHLRGARKTLSAARVLKQTG